MEPLSNISSSTETVSLSLSPCRCNQVYRKREEDEHRDKRTIQWSLIFEVIKKRERNDGEPRLEPLATRTTPS